MDREVFDKATLEAQEGVTNELVNTQSTLEKNTVSLQTLGTTMMTRLLLDKKSVGAKVLRSFNDDGGQTTAEMVATMTELFGLGGDKIGVKPEYDFMDENDGTGPQANNGTPGFQDYGAGTKVTMHGSEMVLPERNVGELAKQLAQAVGTMSNKPTNSVTNQQSDTVNNNTTNMDMTTLNANTTELLDLNKKVAQHLNTLVTIGTMTEKNTKNMNNNLANMDGSLV